MLLAILTYDINDDIKKFTWSPGTIIAWWRYFYDTAWDIEFFLLLLLSLSLSLPPLPSLFFSLALSHLVIPRNSIVLNYCCITDSLCIVCFCLCLYQIPFNLIPLELFGIPPLFSNDSQFVASSSSRYFVNWYCFHFFYIPVKRDHD